jgi:hypothetical protein
LNHAKSSLFLTDKKDWTHLVNPAQAAQTLLDRGGGFKDSFGLFLRANRAF